MSKRLFHIFLLILVTSCVVEKSSNNKFTEGQKSIPNASSPIEKSLIEEKPSEQYQFINVEAYSCIDNKFDPSIPYLLDNFAFDGSSRGLIDLVIPIELVTKIIDDLQKKASDNKLTPELFWSKLDYKLAFELNDVLLNRFILIDKFAYQKLRNIIAYALTYVTEGNINLENALSIIYNEFGKGRKFTLSFFSFINYVQYLPMCNEQKIKELSYVPNNLLRSDHIDGLIKCKNKNHDISLRSILNKKLEIRLEKENFYREIFIEGLTIKNTQKLTLIKYVDREVNINIELKKDHFEGVYLDGTAHSMDYKISDEFGSFSEDDISCRTIKHLHLQ